ncbi:dihydrofolate reductase [Candidatus Woesearchaeota archaeon]|nr:dihydrofolate reductase [Candidatus Woesearchaeota archaeon]
MEIIVIVAVAQNNIIGNKGEIPWHISEDFKHFKEKTFGYPCIMGDVTYESLPTRPLPGRENVVLTFDKNYNPDGAITKYSFEEAFEYLKDNEKVFIIGGASIYRQGMKYANKLEITRIHKDYNGDTKFPEILEEEWKEVSREDREGIDKKNNKKVKFSFITYRKKNP